MFHRICFLYGESHSGDVSYRCLSSWELAQKLVLRALLELSDGIFFPNALAACLHDRSMCPEGTLTVGVTSNAMLKAKSNAHMLSSLQERLEGVREFLRYECGLEVAMFRDHRVNGLVCGRGHSACRPIIYARCC